MKAMVTPAWTAATGPGATGSARERPWGVSVQTGKGSELARRYSRRRRKGPSPGLGPSSQSRARRREVTALSWPGARRRWAWAAVT